MGTTILPQTFTGKFDEMNQQLEKIANAQSTASGGIADAVNLANQTIQSAEAKIVDVESRFNTLTSAQQGASEVVDARKGEVSLRAKIDKIDTAHAAHLADTASQSALGHIKIGAGLAIDVNGVVSAAIKAGTFTRDTSIASGTQSVTGIGFQPSCVMFTANIGGTQEFSIGFAYPAGVGYVIYNRGGLYSYDTNSIYLYQAPEVRYHGWNVRFDADGFTITWTKVGEKTGTALIQYVAFR